MSPDLLLTHAWLLAEDEAEQRVRKPYPPLGLLSLSAYLKREGFAVELLDPSFGSAAAQEAAIAASAAPVLGIYVSLTTRPRALALARHARAQGKTVVLGGPEPAGWPEAYLARGADVIVFGEGELTLAELLPALRARGPRRLEGLAGIAFRDETGQVRRGPPRPALRDLDALPWPDREAIDLRPYLETWRSAHGRSSLNLVTARGCPYRCRWCSHAVFGHGHARRSPEDVAAELAHLRRRYDPDMLWYADDVFTIHAGWLRAFAGLVRERDLALPFECITRADRLEPESAALLAEMGCFRVWLGAESGSARILDAMERGVSPEQVRRAAGWLREQGIDVGLFVMWGYEGEGPRDVEATIRQVARIAPERCLSTVAYPIRGTPYHAEVEDRIRPTKAWEAASDRDMRLAGRPSRAYYAAASRRLGAVHRGARLRRERPRALLARGASALSAWRASRAMRRALDADGGAAAPQGDVEAAASTPPHEGAAHRWPGE